MKNLFGRLWIGPHINTDSGAFALDLTTEAIILHERIAQGPWKKFASVRLDDPEFPIVIGLLRNEAEAHMGNPKPVHLWLPREQVLKLRARIKGGSPSARLRAGFNYIDKETAYRPEDVAIAVAPADRDDETTLLITFVETWREAMDYAAIWGFIPGELSTRAHCADFGADGPVFRLKSLPPKPKALAAKKRHRMTVPALMLVAVAGGTAVWSLGPWEDKSGAPDPLLGTEAVVVANASSTTPPSISGSLAAPDPKPRIQASPPRHFPNRPAPDALADADQPPGKITALMAPDFQAPVFSIVAPTVIAAAPSPLPDPEPEPPGHDPVIRRSGSITALEPPGISSPPILLASIEALMPHPIWRGNVSLITNRTSSSQSTEPVPVVESPPAEPVETAIETIKPIEPGPVAPVIVQVPSEVVEWAEPSKMVASTEPSGVVAGDKPVAPLVQAEPIRPAFAPLPSPVPAPRPERADPSGAGATPVARVPDEGATPSEPVSDKQKLSGQEDPDEPTRFASATSPQPTSRPAGVVMPHELPSLVTLPALTSNAKGAPRPAVTEPGVPIDRTMLVGILGFENGRKALLRLPNGDYRYVIVGDVLDGWRISMIGVDAMRITRNGEERTLLLINR